MTTLLIQTESVPLTVNFPAIQSMTVEQFYEFCLVNRDLRIERTASGEVIIMSPAFSDTGNRNLRLLSNLGTGQNKMAQVKRLTPVQALPCRMEQPAPPMPHGLN
jgi:hypothetical protein